MPRSRQRWVTVLVAALTIAGVCSQSANARGAERIHEVAKGQTLWGISKRYGVSVAALEARNDLRSASIRAHRGRATDDCRGQGMVRGEEDVLADSGKSVGWAGLVTAAFSHLGLVLQGRDSNRPSSPVSTADRTRFDPYPTCAL